MSAPARATRAALAFSGSGLLAAGVADLHPGRPRLRTREGATLPLSPARWHSAPAAEEVAVLSDVAGPVLDLGCGPGRLVRHLAGRGVTAMGVDAAPDAVAAALAQGAPAVLADVWGSLPFEGRWESVLLFDGNIGIGADPAALMDRCADLLAPGGGVVVEAGPPGSGTGPVEVRIEWGEFRSDWFAWATLAASDLPALAVEAGLELRWVHQDAGRYFARLETPWSPSGDMAA